MRRLIENMMGWFGVTQERLCRERAIETPTGETPYWDYYCYVKEHPVRRWDTPTSILCGGRDELCEPDVTARFARQYAKGAGGSAAMADGKPLSRRHIQTEQEERAWQWKKSQKTESPSPL